MTHVGRAMGGSVVVTCCADQTRKSSTDEINHAYSPSSPPVHRRIRPIGANLSCGNHGHGAGDGRRHHCGAASPTRCGMHGATRSNSIPWRLEAARDHVDIALR